MADTIRSREELLTQLFQDAQPNSSITAQDMRDLIVSVQHRNSYGYFDYNDLTTATTQIPLTANVPVVLTNDGLGPQTSKTFAPEGVTDVWNANTNQFDFTQLPAGSMINLRMSLEVVTAGPNTDVTTDMYFAIGGFDYSLKMDQSSFKAAGTYVLSRYIGFYIGDDNTKLNPAEIRMVSDDDASVKVIGWYINVTVRD